MRFFAKKGDANFRALTANLREYSRYSRLRFSAKKRDFAGKRADSRETAVPYHRCILSVYLG